MAVVRQTAAALPAAAIEHQGRGMGKRRTGLIGIAGACALAASAASADTFESSEGKFSAEFPAPPVMVTLKGQTVKGTRYEEHRWSALNVDGYWGVAMFVYAEPRKLDYEANISAAVAAVKGRLASRKTIQQGAVEGCEILIEVEQPQPVVFRERMLWIGGRLYFVVFSGPKPAAAAAAPEIDKFLNSFAAVR